MQNDIFCNEYAVVTMTITKEKIKEAVNILIGRQTPFSDSDIKWSKEVVEKAFSEGYDIEVVCPNETNTT